MVTPIADAALEARLRARLDSLTKPPGSLGRLEDLAVQVGLIQATAEPAIGSKAMVVFCADHGVVEEGVSAYPQEVTAQMMANFRRGGAAINVLCRQYDIEPRIVDLGVGRPAGNLARQPAMPRPEAAAAFELGRAQALADVIGAGEMGIGNTTAAAAVLCAFTGASLEEAVGTGAGLDAAGMARKRAVVKRALELHRPDPSDPLGVLAAVGGREIAAIAGLIVGAAERRRAVVLDGFICCAAALAVRALEPAALDYVVYSHCSAERGHRAMLAALGARPLLDLGMRLGEGTGAALGIGLVESAVRLYREMATFAGAGVSQAQRPVGRD
jgi:nicotinate-nucleotide--dimethylbenzimidazole phosphoribosyltransferase